ncbi:MAG: hypothetical protein LBQ94_13080 [Treponema sp.]|jgi:hypothetical protein|nr:hypothetical protein [Treponema sp.]
MSDVAEVKKLDIAATLKEGIEIGIKNIGPILVNVLLWILTVWVPYLNVGTTIGLSVGIVSKASRGEAISFTEIFDPKYRKNMGEFFLTGGLISLGVGIGIAFIIVPGIIVGLAWSLAPLLVIDKRKSPIDSLALSNSLTYGNKGRMFGIFFIVGVIFGIVHSLLLFIGDMSGSGLGAFINFITFLLGLCEVFVFVGLSASVYRQLAGDV